MSNASDFKISQTGILTKYTGPGGSYAETYAKEHNIPFVAE